MSFRVFWNFRLWKKLQCVDVSHFRLRQIFLTTTTMTTRQQQFLISKMFKALMFMLLLWCCIACHDDHVCCCCFKLSRTKINFCKFFMKILIHLFCFHTFSFHLGPCCSYCCCRRCYCCCCRWRCCCCCCWREKVMLKLQHMVTFYLYLAFWLGKKELNSRSECFERAS